FSFNDPTEDEPGGASSIIDKVAIFIRDKLQYLVAKISVMMFTIDQFDAHFQERNVIRYVSWN
ncbi:hypothetical protein A2U01_0058273, partial [Trifolium medium]|nr:hypothetical protein [Trifolium medium]